MIETDIQHLPVQQQDLARAAENSVVISVGTSQYWNKMECFADILDEIGMHEESRKKYFEIIHGQDDLFTIIRCRRKIISSYVSQRNHKQAAMAADEAIESIRLFPLENQEVIEEYFKIHVEAGFAHYFFYQFEKVEASVKELRRWHHRITLPALRIGFMHVVALSLLMRYRWSKMPEEAFTHAELFLQHARASGDVLAVSMALCNSAFNYLWNEEITESRTYFKEVIDLLREKNFSPLLMAYNYIALGYRMQNNLSMTEQWANLTLEKAINTGNLSYVPYSTANLAWVYAKRNNWLYAEDYARKAKEGWNSFPLIFSYSFVLMDCLIRKNEFEEAGQYAFMLLHPKVKKLPDIVALELKSGVSAWIKNSVKEMRSHLSDAILEAKNSGYY